MLTHMKIAVLILQNAVRVLGLILIVLGIMFWSGRSLELVPIHMRIGEVLVGLLWVLAAIGMRAGVKPALALGAIGYGFIVVAFAMRMGSFLPGGAHEVIRVLHLLLGLGAIGFAESLGGKMKRGLAR
jgi:hypothetical protein